MNTPEILLIEDSEADVMLMKLALEQAGLVYRLTTFNDGGKALEYVSETDQSADSPLPDLVLLDLNIPKADGLEILESIRASPRLAAVPVIVLTSQELRPEKRRALEKVDAKFMLKPSNYEGYMQLGRVIKSSIDPQP